MSTTLIKGATVITLDQHGRIIEDARVVVDGDHIATVSCSSEPAPEADEVIEGSGCALLPAMFNGHCHSPMTFERGWAEDLPLDRWFNERIWVAESALTPDDVYWGAQLAACEMIRSGTVGFNDHYFYMDRVAQVVEASGMKAALTWCVFGTGAEQEVGADLPATLDFAQRWQGAANGRIRTLLGPHSPYICPPDFLRAVATLAKEHQLGLHIHAAESAEQVTNSLATHGKTPIGLLADAGFFDVPCTVAHALYPSHDDLALLARDTVTVARCPATYMKLAMNGGTTQQLHDAGVHVALGSDGPGSNNDMDLLQAMRLLALLDKHSSGDAMAMAGDLPLRMTCKGSARACGFPTSGAITPGAAADLILVDMTAPHLTPRHDLVANLVHSAVGADVRDVMCAGQWLMRNRALLTLDEERILHEADRRAKAMVQKNMSIVREYRA